MENQQVGGTVHGLRLGILLLVIFAVPGTIILGGSLILTAIGLESHKALSLSGLIAVSVAALWGVIVALTGIDNRVTGRATTADD